MKYNLQNKEEVDAAFQYLTELAAKEVVAEVIRVSPKRSLNQNNYLHLLIGAFGMHFGYSLPEAKIIYKEINKDIYQYNKKERSFYRSSADLSVDEMTKSIDRFREKSAEAGCPLPLATDQGWLMSIENDMEKQYKYL